MRIVEELMKAIFGTNTRTQRAEERKITDHMVHEAERKIAKLDRGVRQLERAKTTDEAMRQIAGES